MKLTLRDAFWLMAMVALACGWFVDRRSQYLSYAEDRRYWNENTSTILQAWREIRAENAALRMNCPSGTVGE